MAYQIIYDPNLKQDSKGNGIRRLLLTTAFFLCFLWMVGNLWPEGRELLKNLLIPGNPDMTLQAAEVFAQELGSGFSLADAARNFCIAVLENGYSG